MQCLNCGKEFDADQLVCPHCNGVKSGGAGSAARRIEDFFLFLLFFGLVILVLLQIVMRYGFSSGMPGADFLIRNLLLWLAFFGAAIATRGGGHVKIDALTHWLPGSLRPWVNALTDLFSAGVCGLLFYASYSLVSIEAESKSLSPFYGWPLWLFEIILPAGYLVIGIRFLSRCIKAVSSLISGRDGV